MKSPAPYPKKAAVAALAGALMALAVLPGCGKKAPTPAAHPPAKPAAVTNTTAEAATNGEAEFVSVFDDSPPPGNKGRDPFNPDSTNRNPAAPSIPKTTSAAGPVDAQLKLQGVGGSPGRWVAVINNHILTVTDPPETIRVSGGGAITLKVVEIGSNYADVTIEGTAGIKRLTINQKK
jgi:predicted small lipoprotein YifL